MKPVIFHVDFDSYFVSAARVKNPKLKNLPIAISRDKSHAIAVSVSYELKKQGVKTGMKNYEIKQIVPDAIFIPSDMDLYVSLSNKIFSYIKNKYSQNISVASIDECFLDVTNLIKQKQIQPKELALQMQSDILNVFQIPITIGISHNKFFAKMTTNISKPFGIGFTDENNYQDQFYNLNIKEFHGIGRKNSQKLKDIGIKTIGDFAKCEISDLKLQAIFGRTLQDFLDKLNPDIWENVIYKEELPSGIGNEKTFTDYDLALEYKVNALTELSEKVSKRVRAENLAGDVVVVTIRERNKVWISKQMKLSKYINSAQELYSAAYYIFKKYFNNKDFIGIGVRLTSLKPVKQLYKPINLFNLQELNSKPLFEQVLSEQSSDLHRKALLVLADLSFENKQESKDKTTFGLYRK
ncbi:Y-family DNA polymerase [Mycoplasma nasistruthionis]|uniref:DNA polymerase IV n=1 Tax=Mycoplasma nasistruthionis TaxID=353852 RepID=A0A4Y6I6J7_9MOLU|nr:DNA polymerase IV [Mycoplasma nasistruthionis]QDF64867.1 DNA polymerase IV [Mycoplasma nasistruthionis]